MFKFTKTTVFCIFVGVIFLIIQIFINQYTIETEIDEEIMYGIDEENIEDAINKTEIWQIEIPKIVLKEEIKQGTTKEILTKNIGHFINTSKKEGNVCLAIHNQMDLFKKIRILKKGDEIKYKYNLFEKIYEVEKCRIIRRDELEYLEQTEDNMLTLITYVENQPEYRRCIQAVEKEEEKY